MGAGGQPLTGNRPPGRLTLLLLALAIYGAIGAGVVVAAGHADLPWVWAALGVLAVSHAAVIGVIGGDEGLIRERMHPGPGVPRWDVVVLWTFGALALGGLAVATLDIARWHVSDRVPPAARALGLALEAGGMALLGWAMAVNTFFSKVVRIQSERGHRVIDSGPYRAVRHPGYVGVLALWTGFNLALGSWLGVAFAGLTAAALVLRTALEDRLLRRELEGYAAYAARVRWRLVPWIW